MTSQKISQFNVSTSLNTSDLFTFVVNGTNKNIAFSDFKAGLGVTGVLSQVGDSLGAPVLDVESSTQNNIRNIESGYGINASVSACNGINIATNFTQSATGENIIDSISAAQLKFKTLVGGTGITLTSDGDQITISLT